MSLTQGLHRAIQQEPQREFTICADRVRTISQSVDRIARLAGALIGLGIKPGDHIAILGQNSDHFIEAVYATWWTGAAVVPVNYRWSSREMDLSFHDSAPRVLFVGDEFASRVSELLDGYPEFEHVIQWGSERALKPVLGMEDLIEQSSPIEDHRSTGSDLAGVFYTGGTTGTPKGVMLSHANIATSVLGVAVTNWLYRPGGRFLHVSPMFHMGDLFLVAGQTMVGGTHVAIATFDPANTFAAIEAHRVTSVVLLGSMVQWLVEDPTLADYDLTSLEVLIYGGSSHTQEVIQKVMDTLPGISLAQGYGMTELGTVATALGPDEHRMAAEHPEILRSAGRVLAHAEVRIVDTSDHEVSRGTVGEITVSGDNVMLGYLNKEEATEQAVRGGWMHTGDAGYMDDAGYLYVVDRIKDMIITGGENVYSAEVEGALSQHPKVASCAVVGTPDEKWGERVVAVVIVQPGVTLTATELQDHARTLIAGYKIPKAVYFADSLPVSGAGKVLKAELRRSVLEGAI